MKVFYSRIDKILTGDSRLRKLVDYSQNKEVPIGKEGLQAGVSGMTIRRGFSTEGNWKRLVTYYFQPDYLVQDFSPNIRGIPLVVAIFDRDDDLNMDDIKNRVITLLDGADLSVANEAHCYGVSYAGEIGAPAYNASIKSYQSSIRFIVTARKEQ